jgi:hypothetical protein
MRKICHKVPSYLSYNCMGDPIGFSYPQNITCARQLTVHAVYFLVHYIWFIFSCLLAELIQWLTWTKNMCYMFLTSKYLFLDLPFRFGIGGKARVVTLASVSCCCICWITLICVHLFNFLILMNYCEYPPDHWVFFVFTLLVKARSLFHFDWNCFMFWHDSFWRLATGSI